VGKDLHESHSMVHARGQVNREREHGRGPAGYSGGSQRAGSGTP
jgi:hypothetical protein